MSMLNEVSVYSRVIERQRVQSCLNVFSKLLHHCNYMKKNDARLEFVQNFGIMCFKMAGKQGNRVRQLPKDTASAIHNACMGT